MNLQETQNPKTGKTEYIKVNLAALYPGGSAECCFEEVMARHRKWLEKDWKQQKQSVAEKSIVTEDDTAASRDQAPERVDDDVSRDLSSQDVTSQEVTSDVTLNDQSPSLLDQSKRISGVDKGARPRKKKVMEVKAETQTSETSSGYLSKQLTLSSQNESCIPNCSKENPQEEQC